MVCIDVSAPPFSKMLVAAHNKLHDTHFRRRLAVVPVAVAVLLWVVFYFWMGRTQNNFTKHQYVASDMLATMEAANRALVVVSEDGQVMYDTSAARRMLGHASKNDRLATCYPNLVSPVNIAVSSAKKKPCGHSLVQFTLPDASDAENKLQVNVTAAFVLDRTTIVVSVISLRDLDAQYTDWPEKGVEGH